jgi:ribosomal protein L11 methyltransferase
VTDPSASRWVTVRIEVPSAVVDLVSGLLWSAGVAGIEERPSSVDPDGRVELRAGAEAGVVDDVLATVGDRWPVEVEGVEVDAGLDEWRDWARARRAGRRLVVAPAWMELPDWVAADDVVVHLDPGRAFGSGAHATTRLCLAELEALVRPGDDVFDVGCGSGVLSVAAALLGSGRVVAVDIDPEAVRVTNANAARNGVSDAVSASLTRAEEVSGRFPIVVANIAASTLIEMAPALTGHTTPGGRIVLSGVLADQSPAVTAAMARAGARRVRTADDDDWLVLVFETER